MKINRQDLESLQAIIRHVATSDPVIQAEAVRLHDVLENILRHKAPTVSPNNINE